VSRTVADYLAALALEGEAALGARIGAALVQLAFDDGSAHDSTPKATLAAESYAPEKLPVFEIAPEQLSTGVTVGRGRAANVTIPLAQLSKVHALVRGKDGKLEVKDLGSKNGTFVNNARLAPETPTMVPDGGTIGLGPYPFRVFTAQAFVVWLKHGDSDDEDEGATRTGTDLPAVQPQLEIVGRLGSGGMADVMLARRVGPGGFLKEIALKRLLPEVAGDQHFVEMFLQEARISARINHPNVVQIYDLGWDGRHYFIAMEYVLGWDLSTVARAARRMKVPIPIDVVCRIGRDICEGLGAAHSTVDADGKPLDIIHRDVSPHNVLVSSTGVAKISDFGISRAADSIRRTRPGEIKGKLAYMAPEQLMPNLGPVDRRTDIFGAAVTIYELFSGMPLFPRGESIETMQAVLHQRIADLRELRADVPARAAEALKKALARKPDERTNEIAALGAELGAAAGGDMSSSAVASWLRSISDGDNGLRPPGLRPDPSGPKSDVPASSDDARTVRLPAQHRSTDDVDD
jgi:serine/threonine protein kinase